MRLLYNIISYMSMPILFIRLWLRAKAYPAYGQRLKERLGYVKDFSSAEKTIWFHAVSLGESLAAIPLIEKTLKHFSDKQVVITNMTPTGSEQIQKVFHHHPRVYNCYLPYDIPHLMHRFIRRTHPAVAILMETELWPNALAQCNKRHIPVLLANARLSARSAKGYAYFGSVMREMLSQLRYVAVQAKADGERFVQLGLDRSKLVLTGNIKFDIEVTDEVLEQGRLLRKILGGLSRPIWIAASTHEGEEQQVLVAHKQLLQQFPNALLFLVPRHPDRFNKVAALVAQSGFSYIRRSQGGAVSDQTTVYLGDTLGEMLAFFAASDIAFMGGSLVSTGGHNMLEPAALAKPVLTGTHVFNFSQIASQLEQAGGLAFVQNDEMLASKLLLLFREKEIAESMGANGLEVLNTNRGALDKQFALIKQLVSCKEFHTP